MEAWKDVFGVKDGLKLLYDIAHNISKIERYKINNEEVDICVHRKSATRVFPPGHPEIPEHYRETSQPVLIPGTMGTISYVSAWCAMSEETWHSVSH